MKVYLFTDGGSRGNPGPGGIGFVIYNFAKEKIFFGNDFFSHCTNNQAEYQALLAGLTACQKLKAIEVHCFLDSLLVVKQMKGEYRVKDKDLQILFLKANNLAREFSKITFTHIPREKNKEADALVNQALDAQLKKSII